MAGIDLNTVEEDEEESAAAAAGTGGDCSSSLHSQGSSAATASASASATPPPPPPPRQQAWPPSAVCLELWHACAGPVAPMPRKGSVVVYFPQGHLEQLGGDAAAANAPVPPHVFCRVVDVSLHADASTDEVYAQLSLLPENEEAVRRKREGAEEGSGGEDGETGKQRFSRMPHMFCKTLTASDTSTHGGFSVPRRAAEDCFPPLDYSQQRPSQELAAKDLHGTEWKFRHIYRGQPRRHLLTTGWSAFVNKKKLVSGDAVLFLRGDDGELRLGVRRAAQLKTGSAFPGLYSQCSNLGTLANVAHAVATKGMFRIYYNPRLSQSEFIVPYWKFTKSLSQPFSVGLRFKMRYESEDAAERRYTGIITGTGDADPMWRGSKWKCLLVRWDDDVECRRPNRVSPWEIELTSSASGSHLATPASKRLKPCLSHVNPEYMVPHGGGRPDFVESAQFRKVLQGQELLGYRTHDGTAVATSRPCEARNSQYIDERSCSNDVGNSVLGIPRLGARTPYGNPGFPYHCSGFRESQRFQKVLQGQEVFHPYRGSLVDARIRSSGIHQQDGPYAPGAANKWHSQLHGCAFRGPPAPVLPSQSASSPPSVLMFQQANSKVSRFEFGHGHLDMNEDDRHARFDSTEGVGRSAQTLSLRPHLAAEVMDGHVAVENKSVGTNSCKIFGISLAEKVRARDEMGCGDANYPSSVQSLKQQVPKSLGSSCATGDRRPTMDMMN
ncbi:hypothetical protein BRADI_2g16610v3 [Brachypodium distachyon]|uniref:Auxin response factor n=1 Tax=Brachypodium distachyon TaxID=15368 RepID=I1HGF6_BRADI|nr:hypothetical protein BRADI_2g16610v3 [Brachypodium distachyon]PNT70707.1 hypothetical protein BRADI_2g16610v3 [Brachypodium distachyon]PNT70708.1 hypothetical protein BRADI_2g16610v3 [Brachypodium distachyon]